MAINVVIPKLLANYVLVNGLGITKFFYLLYITFWKLSMLKNINPTQTKSWKNLESHFVDIKNAEMKSLFLKDKNRKDKFTLSFDEMTLDYSKNRITERNLENWLNSANESELADAIQKCFSGEKIGGYFLRVF